MRNKKADYGLTLIILSILVGIILLLLLGFGEVFVHNLSHFTVLRVLCGVLGLLGFVFVFAGGYLLHNRLSPADSELKVSSGYEFKLIAIFLGLLGFLWGYFYAIYMRHEMQTISYWLSLCVLFTGSYFINFRLLAERKLNWLIIFVGLLILASISLGIVIFNLNSYQHYYEIPDTAAKFGIAGSVCAFIAGLLTTRGLSLAGRWKHRIFGGLMTALGGFLGVVVYFWSFHFYPWAWSGYDYAMFSTFYWVSAMLLFSGGLLISVKKTGGVRGG